ncbi:MAG TPA: sialidase family protein [Gaiellaceae bacterium]|nr:sialidase family protein [Gaiellaceae bacterium]
MKTITAALTAAIALACAASASAGSWTSTVPFTNEVASSPTTGGGYPVPPGRTVPDAGTCRPGPFNANHSESWIAVNPGTEDLVGSSKFFFDRFSTFYMFYLGSYRIPNGTPADNKQIEGYDCVSTGTQEMPPSWTNTTDPNVDFDTRGRAYQTMLPFNAFWDGTRLHPDGAIDVVYSDTMGQTWIKGNGGRHLENSGNPSAKQFGHVQDKQWVAVNHIFGNVNQDHVYAAWTIYNGNTAKIRFAVSRDRGQTFARAATITDPNQTGPLNEYVYPAVDAAGYVYVSIVSSGTIYVARSIDDGESFGPFIPVAPVGIIPTCCLPNTTFRDGIAEHFVASQTYPGHLYLTYEDWDGSQFDVKFTYSTDYGFHWSTPVRVNDNTDYLANDQFQPSVAQGPGGAVAVAFYDRRAACPGGPSIRPQDVGRANFCIDTSLQAYRDDGGTVQGIGGNVRISRFTWDPEQPDQTIGGIDQMACAGHSDPCVRNAFIGDYFGFAMSGENVYALMVSTHYPSNVYGDGNQGRIYYQQQVLATVARSDLGIP